MRVARRYRAGIGKIFLQKFRTGVFGRFVAVEFLGLYARHDVNLFLRPRNSDVQTVFSAFCGEGAELRHHAVVIVTRVTYAENDYVAFFALYVFEILHEKTHVLAVLDAVTLLEKLLAEYLSFVRFRVQKVFDIFLLLDIERDYTDGLVHFAACENVFNEFDDCRCFFVVVPVLPRAFYFDTLDGRLGIIFARIGRYLQFVIVESRVREVDKLREVTAVVIGEVHGIISRLRGKVESVVNRIIPEILFDETGGRTQLFAVARDYHFRAAVNCGKGVLYEYLRRFVEYDEVEKIAFQGKYRTYDFGREEPTGEEPQEEFVVIVEHLPYGAQRALFLYIVEEVFTVFGVLEILRILRAEHRSREQSRKLALIGFQTQYAVAHLVEGDRFREERLDERVHRNYFVINA